MASKAIRVICHRSERRAFSALPKACCMDCISLWRMVLSKCEVRSASWALTFCRSLTSLFTAFSFFCVFCLSSCPICDSTCATSPAMSTGVEIESVVVWLTSLCMAMVSVAPFLKASASRRKKPFRVFTTSTVVLLFSWVCAVLGCTTTESFPLLRLLTFS